MPDNGRILSRMSLATARRLAYSTPAERRARLLPAIRAEHGNVRAAARRLGVGWSTLRRWIDADPALISAVSEARQAREKSAPTP